MSVQRQRDQEMRYLGGSGSVGSDPRYHKRTCQYAGNQTAPLSALVARRGIAPCGSCHSEQELEELEARL